MLSEYTGVKGTNFRSVFSEIVLNGPIDRKEISTRTHLAGATVSRVTRALVEKHLIVETDTVISPDRAGRRNILLDLNPNGGFVIGLAINAFEQSISIANLKNELIACLKLELTPRVSADEALKKIVTAIEELILSNGINRDTILGIGAAVAGIIRDNSGYIEDAPTMGWKNVALGEYLEKSLGFKVHIENLPTTVNLAECRYGIAKGLKNVVLLNFALSIGSSFILNNDVLANSSYLHGWLGQLPLVELGGGQICNAENTAAGWAIIHEHQGNKQKEYSSLPGKRLNELLTQAENDPKLQKTLYSAGHNGGRLIELVAGIIQPDAVILSGPMARNHFYTDAVKDYLSCSPVFEEKEIKLMLSDISADESCRALALQRFLLG